MLKKLTKPVLKNLKFHVTIFNVFFVVSICGAQVNYKTIVNDFDKLSGNWKGSLTYLDYKSGKPYTMPAELEVTRIEKTNKFVLSLKYPNESSANSIDTIVISQDGKYIDKELIKSRKKLSNGNIRIVTEVSGKDGNDDKQATIKHSYIFGKKTFSIVKDVQFYGETRWINRNTYSFIKSPNTTD